MRLERWEETKWKKVLSWNSLSVMAQPCLTPTFSTFRLNLKAHLSFFRCIVDTLQGRSCTRLHSVLRGKSAAAIFCTSASRWIVPQCASRHSSTLVMQTFTAGAEGSKSFMIILAVGAIEQTLGGKLLTVEKYGHDLASPLSLSWGSIHYGKRW